jgi:heme/copper-type cytochrome/quinol oxidase subunit 4
MTAMWGRIPPRLAPWRRATSHEIDQQVDMSLFRERKCWMSVPKNVAWFELLLYLALTLDALSVAVQDHTPTATSPWPVIMINAMMAASLILLQVYFVLLAARGRKNWARLALLVPLVITVFSLFSEIGRGGTYPRVLIEIASCALTAIGLYLSFAGDAENWFNE